jgi:hypothetical protein
MAILIVTRLSGIPAAGKLNLRQAIEEASNGDTIVFASDLHGSVDLAKNLVISKSITIDGSQGHDFGIGGIAIGGFASVVVAAGATVTLASLQIVGGAPGASGKTKGANGADGDQGQTGNPGGVGEGGENGGASPSPGLFGSPALINHGTLTLDHVNVSGSSSGGTGAEGGAGGAGGVGGEGTNNIAQAGDGGVGGDGGDGANGASGVGGILNQGSLILKDSAVDFCVGDGGDGGAGGAGGDGGTGGMGGTGGTGGNGGDGGDGGSGGVGIGGILNQGSISIVGAALLYGNTGAGGAGGAGGEAGGGGLGGSTGSGLNNGQTGDPGGVGKTGSTGSGIDNFDGAGPTSGHFSSKDFFEIASTTNTAGQSIGTPGFGGQSFTGFSANVLMEGEDEVAGSVDWRVVGVGGDLQASDFTNGVMSGSLQFSAGEGNLGFGFSFVPGFTPPEQETFQIQLFSPSSGDVLGSGDVLTETLFRATAGADTITGTAGNDEIDGGAGNDVIHGGAGNDVLYGSAGNDTITGGAGNDQIDGGSGADILTGGAGADTFIYFAGDSNPGAPDTITDFTAAQGDRISIAGATTFLGTKWFDGHAGEIVYRENAAADLTHVYYDSNGDKKADTVIVLKGLHTLTASDFNL